MAKQILGISPAKTQRPQRKKILSELGVLGALAGGISESEMLRVSHNLRWTLDPLDMAQDRDEDISYSGLWKTRSLLRVVHSSEPDAIFEFRVWYFSFVIPHSTTAMA